MECHYVIYKYTSRFEGYKVICQRVWEEEEEEEEVGVPVSGTVHGLQGKDVVLHGEGEHVVAVVLQVARRLPQLAVVDVGRGHLLEASPPVFILERRAT